MNEGAAKLIRRVCNRITDPKSRIETRALLTRAWLEGNHRERGRIRRLCLLRARG